MPEPLARGQRPGKHGGATRQDLPVTEVCRVRASLSARCGYNAFVMQLFPKATSRKGDSESLAGTVLDTIPLVMGLVRNSMRTHRVPGLSVPQFRILALTYHHDDVSPSELAEHVGMGLPSASKLIDGLVAKRLLTRTESREDRRRKQIRITATGRESFEKVRERAREALASHLDKLPESEAALIRRAMDVLRSHLSPELSPACRERGCRVNGRRDTNERAL